MAIIRLIADSGATKTEWCLLSEGKKKKIETIGLSPYFLSEQEIIEVITNEVALKIKNPVDEIYFYGTGLANPANQLIIKKALKKIFPDAKSKTDTDITGAARAVCGHEKGLVANLGTGSFCCYYNGKAIAKNSPGIGYILGDEGSGAYLGKKLIQYFLYEMMDEELRFAFLQKYKTGRNEILENVYKKPMANRYLASYAIFLAENRGHYMVENIIEDGLNDFFFYHLSKYAEVWKYPVHFIGSISYGFQDVLSELCKAYQFEMGKVIKSPMEGLIIYHNQ